MVHEQATVLAVHADAVLLAARQQSACESCRAQSGCGQAVLSRLMRQEGTVRALLPSGLQGRVRPGSEVVVAIPMHTVVLGSLLIYLLPVLGLLAGAALAAQAGLREGLVAAAAVAGLVAGGALVRLVSWRWRHHPGMHPVVVECVEGELPPVSATALRLDA